MEERAYEGFACFTGCCGVLGEVSVNRWNVGDDRLFAFDNWV